MSDYKTPKSAYTKIEISHPYLLLSDDQFTLLDNSMDRNTIQYDHMYVQTTPILLFRHMNKKTVASILLNMVLQRSLRLHVPSYITTTLPYMQGWLPPMTSFSSSLYRKN